MAPQPGGRARTVQVAGHALDNGQHILIGAYQATLELMREVGADPTRLLRRLPLALQYPDGQGLQLRAGRAGAGLRARGAGPARLDAGASGWPCWLTAARWAAMRFRCAERLERGRAVPSAARRACSTQLIEPLCVAALNTPAAQASAAVFLRVLRDALFSGPGSSDLLLPRAPLGALLPEPAAAWFERHGVRLHAARAGDWTAAQRRGWLLDGQPLRRGGAGLQRRRSRAAVRGRSRPSGQRAAAALRYEPIVTVYLQCTRCATGAADAGAARARRRTGPVRLRPRRAWRTRRACSPSSSVARANGSTAGWTRRQPPRWRRPGRPSPPAPGRTLPDGAARGRRKARHLPLHARSAAAAGGDRRSACGPPATMSRGPTRPRWRARCVPGATPLVRWPDQWRAQGAASGPPKINDCCSQLFRLAPMTVLPFGQRCGSHAGCESL